MSLNQNKIKLSRQLRMGVGRAGKSYNFFKIGSALFLLVSAVLTIRAGYLLFQPGTETNNMNPQVLGAVDNNAETSQQLFTDYKVKKGDTLFTISKEVGVDWSVLATLNNLKPPFDLKVDQTLKIPKN